MLTRHAITGRAEQDQVEATVVERDYILSHIVATAALPPAAGQPPAVRVLENGTQTVHGPTAAPVRAKRKGPVLAGLSSYRGDRI
jgi:hypothetical protein